MHFTITYASLTINAVTSLTVRCNRFPFPRHRLHYPVVVAVVRVALRVGARVPAASGGAEHDAIVETLLVAVVVAFHPATEVKEIVVLRNAVYTLSESLPKCSMRMRRPCTKHTAATTHLPTCYRLRHK